MRPPPSPNANAMGCRSGAQLVRLVERGRARVDISIDGQSAQAFVDDTVLTAVLTNQARLRNNEFDGKPRAGFCLMGACQECWVWRPNGSRLRACSALVSEGMAVLTHSPLVPWQIPSP